MRDAMKKSAISMLMLPLIFGCAQPVEQAADDAQATSAIAPENMLGNPGFETGDPTFSPWATNVHADPESFVFTLDTKIARQSGYSLRIERVRDEPFASIAQYFRRKDLANRRFRLSAWLRGENLASPAYLLAIPYYHSRQDGVVDNRDRGLSGSFEWTRVELDIQMPARADALEVGVTTTGDGVLWVDDAELVPLAE
jgi:hypothetical protein